MSCLPAAAMRIREVPFRRKKMSKQIGSDCFRKYDDFRSIIRKFAQFTIWHFFKETVWTGEHFDVQLLINIFQGYI